MKDEINCFHNGGGVAYLLQIVAIHFNLTVREEAKDGCTGAKTRRRRAVSQNSGKSCLKIAF